ncbi:leucine-rich repeat-containing protein kinase family protein [Janthinobacterium sp. B9-8]|uniref:leucine-rich repeat-containing protein kinase family protein n=1 Tax=Janthinobacterium sp. B9-8 TaxID=1236179 RepID=UPI00061D2566|nr:leucine-rich repeat-containing protein kinase family protein [Janthinobacterium sp. B9-8]AMC35053.1 protein kinase [Janthinobacterium sp. B9-8]
MHTLSQLRSGQLKGIKRLDLSCGLTTFPEEIFSLADSLEILNLSGNALSCLPDDLPRLKSLKVIFCSDNQFDHLPEVLGRCSKLSMVGFKANQIQTVSAAALPSELRWLILTDNQISHLPAELGQCHALQKLMLAGNRLQSLPETLAACKNLELIRISANQLQALPDWLFSLPKLAWLAFAGNPFCPTPAAQHAPAIHWQDLEVAEQLGEGASGVIYKALWQQEKPRAVALKLFKGALTSDGLPQSEMAACIAAGEHPSLIGAIGQVEHPDQHSALLMPLIDGFSNLAEPPSLESCTRDIYAQDQYFSLENTLKIAHSIAAAAEHLHAAHILHGDLYAHNILISPENETRLGDFGAASFYTPEQNLLQNIEVRAFACLLEELLSRTQGSAATLDKLANLQISSAQATISARPSFSEIKKILSSL